MAEGGGAGEGGLREWWEREGEREEEEREREREREKCWRMQGFRSGMRDAECGVIIAIWVHPWHTSHLRRLGDKRLALRKLS